MTTHNLKDLSTLNAVPMTILPPIKMASYKPRTDLNIRVMTVRDADILTTLVSRRYRATIKYNRQIIDEQFKGLYGKPLYFSDKLTSTLIIRIKEIMALTGKSLKEIGKDLKAYIGKDISFFRKNGDSQIPIDSARIMDAYQAMKELKPAFQIENILFN